MPKEIAETNMTARTWKLSLAIIGFVLFIGPTLISYQAYSFTWDDSDYLGRSIAVSRAFWSGNKHGLATAMPGPHPPVMTLLGVFWGPFTSWDAAGKCFITLTAFNAFFIACCVFMLLRVGLRPLYLAIAAICVFAALGPYPAGAFVHSDSTGFMADSLFGWIAFAATLLIPYEIRTTKYSTKDDILRGLLWAVIFSAGAITKVTFFYFLGLIGPILLIIRMRRSGLRSASISLASLFVFSLPASVYWLLYGFPAFKYGWISAFGHEAALFYTPMTTFLSMTFHQSPGMLLAMILIPAAVIYALFNSRKVDWGVSILPLLVVAGYCGIALMSKNREGRFLITGFIGIPFLVAMLLSGRKYALSQRAALASAAFAFVCLVAAGLPMLHRPDRQSIHRAEEVVTQAIDSNAKRVLFATDSSSLNSNLMNVAVGISPRPSIESDSLAWDAIFGKSI